MYDDIPRKKGDQKHGSKGVFGELQKPPWERNRLVRELIGVNRIVFKVFGRNMDKSLIVFGGTHISM
jgi:hypothetical protein